MLSIVLSMCTMRRTTIPSAIYKVQRLTIVASVLLLLLTMSLVADSQFVIQGNSRINNRHVVSTTAYGQLPTQGQENLASPTETTNTTTTTTTTATANSSSNTNSNNLQNASSFIIRGLIGSTIASSTNTAAAANNSQGNQSGQVEGPQSYLLIGGRWRMAVNQSIVERFVANLTVVGIDGKSPPSNVIIEDLGGSSDFRRGDNALTSEITANIYPGNNKSASVVVPIQVEVRGNNIIQIVPLGITERMSGDDEGGTQESQLLHSIDRQAIYGVIQTREITG
jgi:hypothetical protein